MKDIIPVGSSDTWPYAIASVTRIQPLATYERAIANNLLSTLMLTEVRDTLVVLVDSVPNIGRPLPPDSVVSSDVDKHHLMSADLESMAPGHTLVMDEKRPVALRTESFALGMGGLEAAGFYSSDGERELSKHAYYFCGRGGVRP